MKAFAYWNLHKKCWSLKCLDRGVDYGIVVAHCDAFVMTDCTFKVSEPGRQRVLTSGRKNVHAGVIGYVQRWVGRLQPMPSDIDSSGATIKYNPRTGSHFYPVGALLEVAHSARVVVGLPFALVKAQGLLCDVTKALKASAAA